LIREPGVGYHGRTMELGRNSARVSGTRRALWALALLLLIVAPALDFAWVEPTLGQGVLCQLHANPAVALEVVSPVVVAAAELLPPGEPLGRIPLVGSPIFIPPRA
jgi:hypothetical protein